MINLWGMFLTLDWLEKIAVALAVVAAVFALFMGNFISLVMGAPALILFYRYAKLKTYFEVHAGEVYREAVAQEPEPEPVRQPEPPQQQLGPWGENGPPRRTR